MSGLFLFVPPSIGKSNVDSKSREVNKHLEQSLSRKRKRVYSHTDSRRRIRLRSVLSKISRLHEANESEQNFIEGLPTISNKIKKYGDVCKGGILCTIKHDIEKKEIYKMYSTNIECFEFLLELVKYEIEFQVKAHSTNSVCKFVSPKLKKSFYYTKNSDTTLVVVMVSEWIELDEEQTPSTEEISGIDQCLRNKGISHNDLFIDIDGSFDKVDPLTLDMEVHKQHFQVHPGNCFYQKSDPKKIVILDFGSARSVWSPDKYGGGKWSLKYKRSINCKRPKGFSQKQYCKRQTKRYKK
jgi:hypothetical protein